MPKKENKPITVTTIGELQKFSNGTLVKLPDFGEGMPFVARLKRPSLLAMIKAGKIPNTLMAAANSLFSGDIVQSENSGNSQVGYDEIFSVLDSICESAFVEPTWGELKEAGIELTDEQLIAVFNYTQNGVKALESFC